MKSFPLLRSRTAALLLAGAVGMVAGMISPMAAAADVIAPLASFSLPGAPAQTGDTATDGFNWINYRRAQAGLPALARNGALDTAAQNHAVYQKDIRQMAHVEDPSNPGFSGAQLADRMAAAGYALSRAGYVYGEAISGTVEPSGFNAAEDLVTAIYHRFVIFEPVLKESGAGAASTAEGYTYFTNDVAARNGYGPGIGKGKLAVYPAASQAAVPVVFFNHRESPDPLPEQAEAGYPVSVHADVDSKVTVSSFTLRQRGSDSDLPVHLLAHATDEHTPESAAAIIPRVVLAANTVYEASFTGTVNGYKVTQNWSFTTQGAQ